MANEIKYVDSVSGLTLTANIYQPDGTTRQTGLSLPEVGTSGYYTNTATCNAIDGDVVLITDSSGNTLASEVYEVEAAPAGGLIGPTVFVKRGGAWSFLCQMISDDGLGEPVTGRDDGLTVERHYLDVGVPKFETILPSDVFEVGNGYYYIGVNVSDVEQSNQVTLRVTSPNCQPYMITGIVLTANAYDSFCGGTDTIDANVVNSVTVDTNNDKSGYSFDATALHTNLDNYANKGDWQADLTTLENRLTDARAGYLDILDNLNRMISTSDQFTDDALSNAPTAEAQMDQAELHAALDAYVAAGGDIKKLVDTVEADKMIDISDGAQWQEQLYQSGADPALEDPMLTKDLKTVNGDPIVNKRQTIGQKRKPSS